MGRRRKDSDGSTESDDGFLAMWKVEKCYLSVVLTPYLFVVCNCVVIVLV